MLKRIVISEIGAGCFDKAIDPISTEFSGHAIVHRPTKRQFSKTNAAQGLLCVTSLTTALTGTSLIASFLSAILAHGFGVR